MNKTTFKKMTAEQFLKEYTLSEEEDAKFMANIDMEAMERAVKKAEQEIANGEGIEFEEAMAQIHREVFGEEI